jgi:hypothetical protein
VISSGLPPITRNYVPPGLLLHTEHLRIF